MILKKLLSIALSSFFISHTATSHNKFTHFLIHKFANFLISYYFCHQNIHFCMKKKFSSHIKDMLYVLLLPLFFIFILFIRFFDRMDEKIHIRTILAWIFSPITALYIGVRWVVRKIFGKRGFFY